MSRLPESITMQSRAISEAPESPQKASDTVTLTITFPEGTEVLNGVFEANNGKYLVSIEKAEW